MKVYILNTIRTNNYFDMEMMKKTENLWKESKEVLKNYKGKIYGVYYDYSGDYKGDYSLGVGSEIDIETKEIIEIGKEEEYRKFTVDEKDKFGVFNTWHKIWELEDSGELERRYFYDYEVYYPDGKIEIYLGIK